MTQHLVITTVGSNRPRICHRIVQLVTQSGCNIVDSRIALFGSEFTLIMLLSGNNNAITRVETMLPLLGQEHDLITMTKRTSPHHQPDHLYLLEVSVQSDDRLGLTEKFTQFFAEQQIDLHSLSAQTVEQSNLSPENKLFQLSLSAILPAESDQQQLQRDFTHLCTTLKVEGTLHFVKHS